MVSGKGFFFGLRSQRNLARFQMSLDECFASANDEIYTRSHGFLENRAYRYYAGGDRLKRVSDFLEVEAGVSRFEYVGCGDNAIVVRYGLSQALRFRAPPVEGDVNTHGVLRAEIVCPVWKEVLVDDGRLNFVPYLTSLRLLVERGSVSRSTAESYILSVLGRGFNCTPALWFYDYKNFDFKFEQIGLLQDGTPIIIDQGAVILASNAPRDRVVRMDCDQNLAQQHRWMDVSVWDGVWSDTSGDPKIDLLERPSRAILELPDRLPIPLA